MFSIPMLMSVMQVMFGGDGRRVGSWESVHTTIVVALDEGAGCQEEWVDLEQMPT